MGYLILLPPSGVIILDEIAKDNYRNDKFWVAFFESVVYNTFLISGCGPVGRALDLGDLSHLFGASLSNPNTRCNTSTFSFLAFIKNGQICGLTTVLTTTVRITFSASNSISGCGPVGRALDLGSRCREFESPHSDQKTVDFL